MRGEVETRRSWLDWSPLQPSPPAVGELLDRGQVLKLHQVHQIHKLQQETKFTRYSRYTRYTRYSRYFKYSNYTSYTRYTRYSSHLQRIGLLEGPQARQGQIKVDVNLDIYQLCHLYINTFIHFLLFIHFQLGKFTSILYTRRIAAPAP